VATSTDLRAFNLDIDDDDDDILAPVDGLSSEPLLPVPLAADPSTVCGYETKCLNVCVAPRSAGGIPQQHLCAKCKVTVHNLCCLATGMVEEGQFMCPKCLPFADRAKLHTMQINAESGKWE
jgi:hypothetical protein